MNMLKLLFVLFPLFISFAAYPNWALWKAAKAENWKEVKRIIEKDASADIDYEQFGISVREILENAGKWHLLGEKDESTRKRKTPEPVSKSRGEKAPVVRQLKSDVPVIEPREFDREEELTEEEKSSLVKLAGPIVRQWGYRTGPGRGHEHFEVRTLPDMRVLQYFTDPVFRNLSNLAKKEPLLSYDLQDYLRKNTTDNPRAYMRDDIWRPLLAEFMLTEGGASLRELANLNVDSQSSEHFAIIVGMARILVEYAYGNRNLPGEGDDLADILGVADL